MDKMHLTHRLSKILVKLRVKRPLLSEIKSYSDKLGAVGPLLHVLGVGILGANHSIYRGGMEF